MAHLFTRRRKKHGLPPGSLVFLGEEKSQPLRLCVIDYDGETLSEFEAPSDEELAALREAPTVSWIDIDGVHDVETIGRLGALFEIHPLVLEDIVSVGQRPKLEEFDGYLFLVLKMHSYDPLRRSVQAEQVALVVGPTWILSFHEDPGDIFDVIRERLRARQSRLRHGDAVYLAYSLLDVVVDHYFLVLEALGDEIEALEDQVLTKPDDGLQQRIITLRRELIMLRRTAWPLRELLSVLDRSDSRLITPETKPYFRDVYDHIVQVIDIIESMRDVLGGLMELYMSSLSNRMNEIMKFLTIVGTIFIPLTFIVGVYGMNFDFMPELHTRWGYPAVWALMLGLAAALVWYFRRRRWL